MQESKGSTMYLCSEFHLLCWVDIINWALNDTDQSNQPLQTAHSLIQQGHFYFISTAQNKC